MTDLSDTAIAELSLVAMALAFLGFIAAMMAKDIYLLEVPQMLVCPKCGMLVEGGADEVNAHQYDGKCETTPEGDVRLLQALAAGSDRLHPTEVFARVLLRLVEQGRQTLAPGWLHATSPPFSHTGPSLPPQSSEPLGTSYTHKSLNPADR